MDELKLCPFCGGKAVVRTFITKGIPRYSGAYIECTKCTSRGEVFYDIDSDGKFIFDAIKAWNRRATDT